MNKSFAGIGLLALAGAASAQSFTQSFTDVTTLPAAGWAVKNNSDSADLVGGELTNHWYQGNSSPDVNTNSSFTAQDGSADGFVSSDFGSSTSATSATLSNWLFAPTTLLTNGSTLSFYAREGIFGGTAVYPDRIEVRLSKAGTSTNVGVTSASVGDFTTTLLTINPSLTTTGFPTAWTQYSATISGLTAPVSGRLAFRYYVTDGGSAGNNSGRFGIDTLSYTAAPVPEPSAFAALGLGAVAVLRRRRKA